MRRDIVNFLFDNLAELQAYDAVKVYYDNGQHSIAESLHLAIEYALSKDAVVYRSRTALRVPAFAGGGLHLHHGTHSDQVRGACGHRDGREVLRKVVRLQEGHS